MENFIENLLLHEFTYQASLILYGVAALLYLIEFIVVVRKNRAMKFISTSTFVAALIFGLWWFFDRWVEAGRAPIRSRYESLVLYSLCVAFVYVFIEFFNRVRIMGFFSALSCLLILVYATINKDLEIEKLPPALQSAWFVPHVISYFFGYGALTLAFVASLAYQFVPRWEFTKEAGFTAGGKGTMVTLNLEEFSYELIKFGFVTLTVGLILGAVWAKFSWGDYWSWDPKENWALITWLIYLTYLHFRFIPGYKGRISAAVATLGYLAVMFTYLGMKYLPTAQGSLHVYQG